MAEIQRGLLFYDSEGSFLSENRILAKTHGLILSHIINNSIFAQCSF